MRYIPGLIPEGKRVLRDYFDGRQFTTPAEKPIINVLFYVIGVLLFAAALVYLSHPIPMLLFAFSGAVVFPVTRTWIEEKLVFRLTLKLRICIASFVLLAAIPIAVHYNNLDEQQRIIEKLQAEKEEAERLAIEKREAARKDSLHDLLREGRELIESNRLVKANEQLDIALAFARGYSEKAEIASLRFEIDKRKVEALVQAGRFRTAIPILDQLIRTTGEHADLLYNRGLCYAKIGKTQEAVNDLRKAADLGNSRAGTLHERINPIRRRVAYYVTRCCDGSTSSAKGRGACSHHHGVCNWNDPVYEEYRKY